MLFKNFNLSDLAVRRKLLFNKKLHSPTWSHYSQCYDYVLYKIFSKGLRGGYRFNCKARALLFLFRQSLELTIKKNLAHRNLTFPNTHDLQVLLEGLDDTDLVPTSFKEVVSKISIDDDGVCFRYYLNKETLEPYFAHKYEIPISPILKLYNEGLGKGQFMPNEISPPFDYSNPHISWDLTLQMHESRTLGHIRSDYHIAIEEIVEGVLSGDYDLKKAYLPLLFLIRHSLELALKFNLINAKAAAPEKVPEKRYEDMHSLSQLYNCFAGPGGFLGRLDMDKMSHATRGQYKKYRIQYDILNDRIHQFDKNSMFFRFPVDDKGKVHNISFKKDSIIDILELYRFTDPFITFTIEVLQDEGLINPPEDFFH